MASTIPSPSLAGTLVRRLRAALPDVQAVYLYGSQASGHTRSESDMDVAVLLPRTLAPDVRWSLAARLADGLRTDVDLLDLRAASAVMRYQVITTGRLLYERNAAERQRFELAAFNAYFDLNIERRAILDDIRRRGSVYGGGDGNGR